AKAVFPTVAELLIYNSALSSTDRANVEAYLNAKYNINGGLGQSAYLKDSSGNGNNGTPVGTTLVQGKIGNARNFNGTSDYIDAGSGNSLNIGGNLTLEGWFRTTDNSNNITMISKGTDNNWLYYLGKTNTNTVTCKIYQSGSGSGYLQVTSTNTVNDGNWHYAACTLAGTTLNLYVDGILAATSNTTTGSRNTTTTGNFEIGKFNWSSGNVYWNGSLDEVRVSNIARSATDIRQAYEVGLRTHQITIDFGASLDNLNTISGSGDTSFIIDATQKGLAKKGSNLYLGDKIIVRETFSGTEYIAQGTVNSVNTDTGAVTVASWDAGSTFPASGFDSGADVFKWQREYWNIKNAATQPSLDMNAVTLLSLRFTDGNEGRTVWLDDLRDATDYMNNPAGTAITSATGYRYMQYRAVFNSVDPNVAASLSSVTVNDTLQAPPAAPSLDSPTNAATSQSPVLQLKTTATDPNSDYVRYKIAVCTDSAMTQNCQTFDQTASQTGWSGQNAQTGTAYASGTQGVYTVQYASLQPLTTYYWDSYVIDPGGSNTWSATQGSPYSFTTAHIPNKPTLDYPANQAQNISVLTPLKTTATDSLGDYLRYKIQICTDINMSVGCQTFDQTSSQAGWSGQNTQSNTAYTSGTQAVYTIQSALSTGSTYYWKSYAIDPGGTNAWSATQTTPNVFYTTTAVPPLAPTGLLVNGLTNPTNISLAATPYFSAVHNDAANLSANYYQIQVSNQPDVNGTLLWDSGQVGMATTVNGARSPNVTYAGTTLTAYGQTYYWRIRFWNTASSSSPGAWSAVNNFSIISVVSPASCLLVKNNSNTQITVNWTTRASANNDYLEKNTDGAGFSAYQTLAGATNTYADTSVSSGHTYQYRVRSKTGSDYSDWCTTATLSLAIGNIRFNGIK
ncbi:LamG domain-containing protein, partial [Patescibacteria group bacterium]|nr:LamG domain-containing protein [Patescibacteria group bacterium]